MAYARSDVAWKISSYHDYHERSVLRETSAVKSLSPAEHVPDDSHLSEQGANGRTDQFSNLPGTTTLGNRWIVLSLGLRETSELARATRPPFRVVRRV